MAHEMHTRRIRRLNKTILKSHVAAALGCANMYTWDFADVKFRVAELIR